MESISLLTTNDIKLIVVLWAVTIISFGLAYLFANRFSSYFVSEVLPAVFIAVGILFFIFAFIFTGIFVAEYMQSPHNEIITYNSMIVEGEYLQEVVDTTKDIINTDIYQRVIDFNSKLNVYQHIIDDPFYKPARWSLDWSQIPFVELGEVKNANFK